MMKLRSTLTITTAAAALWTGGFTPTRAARAATAAATAPTATVADRPVLWSVRFDAERLRSGLGRELFSNLDPILTALSGERSSLPGGKLESVALFGFQPPKPGSHDFPVLADLTFTADNGGIVRRFEAVSRKHDAPVETVAGFPAIHFAHQGKEVWIGKFSDVRVLVATSRALLEPALASGAGGFTTATPPKPNELLGGNVEIKFLLTGDSALRNSELLNLLPHLDFHILSDGAQLDLDASAELDGDRSARRAARMIDGMVAALSLQSKTDVPWDERLTLKQDGAQLAMKLHLEPQEAKKLFDNFVREIQNAKTKTEEHRKANQADDKAPKAAKQDADDDSDE